MKDTFWRGGRAKFFHQENNHCRKGQEVENEKCWQKEKTWVSSQFSVLKQRVNSRIIGKGKYKEHIQEQARG